LSFLGFLSLPKLSIRLNPSESLPSLNVSYNWEIASAYTTEREVTNILEGGLGI
jgi:multidrug efflux pump subunit AcrB